MAEFSVEESLSKSGHDVWEYITDFSRASEWMPGVEYLRHLDEGEIGRGSRLQFEIAGKQRQSVVSYWHPEKCFTLVYDLGGVISSYTYTIENDRKDPDSCVLKLKIECNFRGIRNIAAPLIFWAIRRADGAQIRNIKSRLEKM